MKAAVSRPADHEEFETAERCSILEVWNVAGDPAASVARATVEPGVTTERHFLEEVVERLLFVRGQGTVDVDEMERVAVGPGDVVVVPAGVSQSVRNDGDEPLVFYCVCTPRFTPACYRAVEPG